VLWIKSIVGRSATRLVIGSAEA